MSRASPAARSLLFSRCLAGPAAAAAPRRASSRTTASSSTISPSLLQPSSCHQFHSSAPLAQRRRPRFSNVRAAEMGLLKEEAMDKFAKSRFPEYTAADKRQLAKRYSAEQLAALEAGEAAVDPRDLAVQGRLRVDPYRLPYVDDFKDLRPVVDKRPRVHPPPDPDARFMDIEEFVEDMMQWSKGVSRAAEWKVLGDFVPHQLRELPPREWPDDVYKQAKARLVEFVEKKKAREVQELARGMKGAGAEVKGGEEGAEKGLSAGPTRKREKSDAELEAEVKSTDFLEWMLERSSMTDRGRKSNSALAPALPNKVPGVAGLYNAGVDPEDGGMDDSGQYQELKRQTGLSLRAITGMYYKVLVVRFVHNQTRLGKVRSSSVMVVAGNRDGWLGLGMAKSVEHATAVEKARQLAIRNMRPVRRYEKRTIYGNVEAKVGATIVQLSARPPGFGLRVSHRIFEMCRAAGLQDLAAKMPRSRNPMNSVKAAYQALMNQPDPEQIAMGRGKKLVDVRKVYYGGSVL